MVVQIFQRPDFMNFCLPQISIHHLVELFHLAFGFSAAHFRMPDGDSQPGQRQFQLPGNILRAIIKVAGIKFSKLENAFPEGILNNGFFLIVIKD
jgi:hypothetical protein